MAQSTKAKDIWNSAPQRTKGKYFEYVIQAIIDVCCNQGDVAVDVGANWGSHTHVMLEAVGPSGKVFAVEPDPTLVTHLQTWRNTHSNLEIIPVALSDHEGAATLFRAEETGYNSLNQVMSSRVKEKDAIHVDVRRLDQLSQLDNESIAFIKIDVEGEEFRVLKGAENLIRRCQPIIVAEIAWNFIFGGEGKPDQRQFFEWLECLSPGGYKLIDLFGREITKAEADAWNVVMAPSGYSQFQLISTLCDEAGQRFFDVEAGWDPMTRFRKSRGGS